MSKTYGHINVVCLHLKGKPKILIMLSILIPQKLTLEMLLRNLNKVINCAFEKHLGSIKAAEDVESS